MLRAESRNHLRQAFGESGKALASRGQGEILKDLKFFS